ncbi:MAG: NADP-dependent oxidoreductase [Gammaproteobacteria bacterium]|nr:NADP-dependent oxidoreductase [Gammaproteobacteria bacterium]
MREVNRQWRLAAYPKGLPRESDWTLTEAPVPVPGAGQMLVRASYLDVAPYMRGRISPQTNYAAGVAVGEVMVGGAVGEVLASNCPQFDAGDLVVTEFDFGWQDYALLTPAQVRRVDTALAPAHCWLDLLGLNGVTAYFGLAQAEMRPGDSVVISAAAGSVGQLAGQIAKIGGCRVIAITSSEAKLARCRELGYDDGIAYRIEPDLAAAVKRVCPRGVDVFFDNTAGPIHDAVVQNLALNARVTLCGTVSLAARFGEADIGPRFLRQIMIARARVQGFLVFDYAPRYDEARARLAAWYGDGRIRLHYDIADGLASQPRAFLRLLGSENLGKQLVRNDAPAGA